MRLLQQNKTKRWSIFSKQSQLLLYSTWKEAATGTRLVLQRDDCSYRGINDCVVMALALLFLHWHQPSKVNLVGLINSYFVLSENSVHVKTNFTKISFKAEWWLMCGLLALKKLRQEDQSSRTNLDYIGAPEQRAPVCVCMYTHVFSSLCFQCWDWSQDFTQLPALSGAQLHLQPLFYFWLPNNCLFCGIQYNILEIYLFKYVSLSMGMPKYVGAPGG